MYLSCLRGYTTFDDMLAAMLTIFQSITMEGWTDVMYQIQVRSRVILLMLSPSSNALKFRMRTIHLLPRFTSSS